eukprot:TRINITY_DN4380_c0_g1_i1.p2 TRINITY_DN4380_c0_g1~~TRINITY_DN4380_c0_g1_i1.p2  ORF type:complete len:170 (-),score=23.44 TRINITY_DN4380_c0_g1_i1:689-1198(-)
MDTHKNSPFITIIVQIYATYYFANMDSSKILIEALQLKPLYDQHLDALVAEELEKQLLQKELSQKDIQIQELQRLVSNKESLFEEQQKQFLEEKRKLGKVIKLQQTQVENLETRMNEQKEIIQKLEAKVTHKDQIDRYHKKLQLILGQIGDAQKSMINCMEEMKKEAQD